MEIRPVVADLFHEDGRTDGYDGTNSSVSQFFELSKKSVTVNADLPFFI